MLQSSSSYGYIYHDLYENDLKDLIEKGKFTKRPISSVVYAITI